MDVVVDADVVGIIRTSTSASTSTTTFGCKKGLFEEGTRDSFPSSSTSEEDRPENGNTEERDPGGAVTQPGPGCPTIAIGASIEETERWTFDAGRACVAFADAGRADTALARQASVIAGATVRLVGAYVDAQVAAVGELVGAQTLPAGCAELLGSALSA